MPAPGPTALVDVVDESNEPVDVVPRSEVFTRGANFRTVHVLVFNSLGELLLQQLSASRERHPGRWGSSVAGYLHAGESYAEAARRRTGEELGLSVLPHEVGVVGMADGGVTKFIGVFTLRSDEPRNALPEHIADLEFRPMDVVRADLARSPEAFTDSLREVFAYYEKFSGARSTAR